VHKEFKEQLGLPEPRALKEYKVSKEMLDLLDQLDLLA
jgi:hypothetical protein